MSFATGASAIFVVAIIALAVIICCWLRAKGQRRSKHRHRQLLSTIKSAIVPGPQTGDHSSESHGSGVYPSKSAKWVRTPSGWASAPGPYLPPDPGPIVQLPFPQFPPVCYDGSTLERGGYPAYPFPRIGGKAGSYHCRTALQQPTTSRFVEIIDEEPVARRTRSSRTTVSVATAAVPMSWSSSRTRFSNVP